MNRTLFGHRWSVSRTETDEPEGIPLFQNRAKTGSSLQRLGIEAGIVRSFLESKAETDLRSKLIADWART